MPSARAKTALFFRAAMTCLCLAPAFAQASASPPLGRGIHEAVQVHFDGTLQETRVSSRLAPGSCLSLTLPREWRLAANGGKLRLESRSLAAAIEIALRSERELKDLPQPDLAGRDAALLQRDWEGMLGRPAQSVSLASTGPGALRWTATWFDARFPAPSQAMTVETFIVPLSRTWVAELSLTEVASPEVYDALVRQVLSRLKMSADDRCRN